MSRKLTQEAQDDADDFYIRYEDRGCTCFISPPCSYCLHPGHPLNLEGNDSAWVEEKSVTQSRNKREGHYGGYIAGHHIRGWTQQCVDRLRGRKAKPANGEAG